MHEISNNVICVTSKASDQSAHWRSLIRAFACRLILYDSCATDRTAFGVSKLKWRLHRLVRAIASCLGIFVIVKLLTENHLEFLSLKGGYTGSSEPTHVKMSQCLKSRAGAQI